MVTPNAFPEVTKTAGVAGQQVALRVEACLTIQRPGLSCMVCKDSCPTGAISITGRNVDVSDAACSGCGRCSAACPTGALTVDGFQTAAIYECARVPAKTRAGEVVPCLGGIMPSHLRRALRDGNVTLMDRGWCAECPASDGERTPWSEAVDTVNREAHELGLAQRVQIESAPLPRRRALPAPASATANPSRRALFSWVAQAQKAQATCNRLEALPERVDTSALRERADVLVELSEGRPLPAALFPLLSTRDGTLDLRMVAAVCPTAALDTVENGQEDRLMFDAAICIGCGECTRASTGTLVILQQGAGEYQGPIMLARQARKTCMRCCTRFTPLEQGQTICDNCRKDTELAMAAHGLMRHKRAGD